jgi:hypothetical protein
MTTNSKFFSGFWLPREEMGEIQRTGRQYYSVGIYFAAAYIFTGRAETVE